jgi:hypothetical protein
MSQVNGYCSVVVPTAQLMGSDRQVWIIGGMITTRESLSIQSLSQRQFSHNKCHTDSREMESKPPL